MALLVDRDNLGGALHTALRKECDTTETSLAWNLIGMYTSGEVESGRFAWHEYLDNVWSDLQHVNETYTYQDVLKNSAEQLDYGSYYRNALRNSMKLFSRDDWTDMGIYLYE